MSNTTEKKARKIKIEDSTKIKTAYEVLIIDRSSSMSYQKEATIKGINDYVKGLKESSTKHGIKTQIMMIMFDSEVETLYAFTDIEEFVDLNNNTYIPGGMTALNDAVMLGIEAVKSAVKGREQDEDVDVTINIFTDGFENASKKYPNNEQGENLEVKGLVKELCDAYKWTITYSGAGTVEQAVAAAQALNIPVGNTLNYAAGAAGPAGPQGALRSSTMARSMKMASFATGQSYDSTSYFASVGADVNTAKPSITQPSNRSRAMMRSSVSIPDPVDVGLLDGVLDTVTNLCVSAADTVVETASSAVDVVSDVGSAACDCASSCCD
jgi:hypothetical protein